MSNIPTEIDLLRRVAAAGAWVIESNGDDPVGRDGRQRFGMNAMFANGELNGALKALREHYGIVNCFGEERKKAADLQNQLKRRISQPSPDTDRSAA